MSILETIPRLQERIKNELSGCNPQVWTECPLDDYIRCLDRYPPLARWSYVSRDVLQYGNKIRGMAGEEGLGLYHQALFLALIARASEQLPAKNFPADIPSLYEEHFGRIVRGIEQKSHGPGFYVPPRCCKDLTICTFRAVPAGMQLLYPFRLPRAPFFKPPLRKIVSWIRFVGQFGGLGPFYEMHTHSDDTRGLLEFTRAGAARMYRRAAAMLRRNASFKGLIGGSWINDPALESISPRLAAVATIATDNGARLFCLGPCNAGGIGDATQFSHERRQLYQEGKYTPMEYFLVWPRKELLAWAEQQNLPIAP
jgi:hypothetical protein